ncbi:hypothetical protein ACFXGR_44385 [Streptomyces mirabilis]|uniref:hypothetical protein n=1 Tax=Streptomyces mirabilis TaxID=68239 RepID=UPI00369FD306
MTQTPPMTVKPLRLWRWRRNPLRRHSDVVEAWIVLATWICALSGGTLAGAAAAQATDAAFAARRAQVHTVSAVLTDDAARTALGGSGYDDGRVWAVAPAGTRITVWTDHTGRVVSAPVTGAAATLQAALTGALVAPSGGAAVWTAGWVVRTGLVRRRMAAWDQEWKQVGPRWGNLSGGKG